MTHRPLPEPLSQKVQVLQTGRVADELALTPFYAPCPLLGVVPAQDAVDARVLCALESELERWPCCSVRMQERGC